MEAVNAIKVLLVDDNQKDADELTALLQGASEICFEITHLKHPRDILAACEEEAQHVLFVSQALLDNFGAEGIHKIREAFPALPLLALAHLDESPLPLLQNQKRGGQLADDVVVKGFIDSKSLVRLIHAEIQHKRLVASLSDLLNQQNVLFDELTGLPNRLLFMDRLNQAVTAAKRDCSKFAMLVMDINECQALNEQLGRDSVDGLLASVAKRLQGCIHSPDTIARYSGDKFAVILTKIENTAQVAKVAQIIQRVASEPYEVEGEPMFLTASIGASIFPADGGEAKKMLNNVEEALVNAKEQGNETIQFYHPKTQRTIEKQLRLEKEMRLAWARGEFVIHYQPLVEADTTKTVGIHAQMRWSHPERGLVEQDEFFKLASETGLLFPLTDWLMRTVCRQQLEWQEQGLPAVPISVNCGVELLKRDDLADSLDKLLKDSGFDPSFLILEFDEAVLAANKEIAGSRLHALKDIGVTITLSDFGGASSSTKLIQNMPIDNIKLSDELHLGFREQNADYVKATLMLANSQGKAVMASGVRDEEQAKFLHEHGCHVLQGDMFSKPVGIEQAVTLLKQSEVSALFQERADLAAKHLSMNELGSSEGRVSRL